jgi:energy-coupling factor transporter ATP-binding protein EcfA2
MLIGFNVRNFRSIRDTAEISMSATSTKEHRETNTFDTGVKGLPNLLRSAAVYGPNAAGKSTLVQAFQFIQHFVLTSHSQQQGQPIPFAPFLLDPVVAKEPGEFEVHFIEGGVRYQYGFEVTASRVMSEWLVAYPVGRPQRWFDRSFDPQTGEETFEFSSLFQGGAQRQLWKSTTRANALFLSTAIQLNNEQMRPVFDWFSKRVTVIAAQAEILPNYSLGLCGDEAGREKMMQFMKAADINIAGIELRKTAFAPDLIPPGLPDAFRDLILKDFHGKEMASVRFRHETTGGGTVEFDLREESHGTQRLFWLAAPWLDILQKGRVLIVDEIDASLHPVLLRFLVGLFHDPKVNTTNAQLIFTTHSTSLLDDRSIRRDQFWFVEKGKDNGTRLYPLSDFHPRKPEALETGYLKGRYGALPFVRKIG